MEKLNVDEYIGGRNLNYLNPEAGITQTTDSIKTYLEAIDEKISPLLASIVKENLPKQEEKFSIENMQGSYLREIFDKEGELTEIEKKIKLIAEVVFS